ncbi:MAG: hypothetical protein ABTQ25_03535 [Nitrosomonas ureae]
MKTIPLLSIVFALVACQPMQATTASVVTPNVETATPSYAVATATSIPPTAIYPPDYPTPINTPHISPTMIGQSSFEESLDFNNTRVAVFEGTLNFTVEIVGVTLVTWVEPHTLFQVAAKGTLRNISDKAVVLRRDLSTGFDFHQDVSWELAYANGLLPYSICCVDYFGGTVRSEQDYVLLQPGDFQNYSWIFVIPTSIDDTNGNPVNLSGKTIDFTASYNDLRPGHDNMIRFSDPGYYFVDMNSWVGTVKSNSTSFLFP